jgi:hypothetical protein
LRISDSDFWNEMGTSFFNPQSEIRNPQFFSVSRCRLISHLAGGVLNRFDDVLVAGAAAQIPFEPVANLVHAGIGIPIEYLRGGHDHSRRAVTALQTVLLPESFLHGMQISVCGHAFNGCDAGAISLNGKHRARLYGHAIDDDGTGTADRGLAPDVRSSQPNDIAYVVDEQHAWLDILVMFGAVDSDSDGFLH